MRVTSTVAALGTPITDGELGIIRVGSGVAQYDELLVWNLAQQVWTGRPSVAMTHVHQAGMSQSGNMFTWGYPFGSSGAGEVDNGFGFQIHSIPFAKSLYDAGLRIQERLSGIIKQGDTYWKATSAYILDAFVVPLAPNGHSYRATTAGTTGGTEPVWPTNGGTVTDGTVVWTDAGTGSLAKIALNWYSLDPGDDFLSPAPDNIGLALEADTEPLVKRRHVTGWKNSPITAPTKFLYYPEIYTRGVNFTFYEFTSEYRWVAGNIGSTSTGGTDGSNVSPPVSDHLYSWHVADYIPRADGAVVDTWADYSGSGGGPVAQGELNRSLIGTGTSRPLLVKNGLNGHALVRFDGLNDYLSVGVNSINEPYTVFLVMKQYGGGTSPQVWMGGGNGSSPLIYRGTDGGQVNFWTGAGADTVYAHGAWPLIPSVVSVQFSGATSNIWENKTLKATGGTAGSGLGGLTIGARGSDKALNAQIDVAEVLIFYRTLNSTERNSIIDWLNAKYNLF